MRPDDISAARQMAADLGISVEEAEAMESIGTVVHQRLLSDTDFRALQIMTEQELMDRVRTLIEVVIHDRDISLSARAKEQMLAEVLNEVIGYGPIQNFLDDPTISEVMVNGPDRIYIERSGRVEATNRHFMDDGHVRRIIDKIVAPLGRRLDEATPMVDARLPDGSRVNAIIPPISVIGPCLTIRKFAADPFTAEDLVAFGTMSDTMRVFLEGCVLSRLNILVSGGTGSGKTTTLNVLSSMIPHDERIITVEDAAELQLQQDHVITLESRPPNLEGRGEITIRDLVRNCLRMRPDRIVVGECRGAEALDMLQAMNTGHDGSITTVHSNSPRDTLSRIETLVLMANANLPSRAIREQVSSALDVIIHQERLRDGTRRLTNITEVQGLEGDTIVLQDLFTFKRQGFSADGRIIGSHEPCGVRPLFMERMEAEGVSFGWEIFEPTMR
jgi:pilus assembly protein CpaF